MGAGGVGGLACSPTEAGPCAETNCRKNPVGHFLAGSIHPGPGEPQPALIGWSSRAWLLFTHGRFRTPPVRARAETALGASSQKNRACHSGS